MTRLPTTDRAFDQWMQSVEDRLARLERGSQLHGHASFDDEITIGDVTITTRRDNATATTDVILTRRGGTPIILVTLT